MLFAFWEDLLWERWRMDWIVKFQSQRSNSNESYCGLNPGSTSGEAEVDRGIGDIWKVSG